MNRINCFLTISVLSSAWVIGQDDSRSIEHLELRDLRYMVIDRGSRTTRTNRGWAEMETLTVSNLSNKPITTLAIVAVSIRNGRASLEVFSATGQSVDPGGSLTLTSTIPAGTPYQLIAVGPQSVLGDFLEWMVQSKKRELEYLIKQSQGIIGNSR